MARLKLLFLDSLFFQLNAVVLIAGIVHFFF